MSASSPLLVPFRSIISIIPLILLIFCASYAGGSGLILCTSSLLGDRRHLENALELYKVLNHRGTNDILVGYGLFPTYLTQDVVGSQARIIDPKMLKPKNLRWIFKEAFKGDDAFMYIIGHGSNGNMLFQGRLVLSSKKLWNDIRWAHESGLFNRLLLIIETCQAETMLDKFQLDEETSEWLSIIISSVGTQPSFALPPDPQAGIPLRSRFNVALCMEAQQIIQKCQNGIKDISVGELADKINKNNIGSTVASRGGKGIGICSFICRAYRDERA